MGLSIMVREAGKSPLREFRAKKKKVSGFF